MLRLLIHLPNRCNNDSTGSSSTCYSYSFAILPVFYNIGRSLIDLMIVTIVIPSLAFTAIVLFGGMDNVLEHIESNKVQESNIDVIDSLLERNNVVYAYPQQMDGRNKE